MIIVSEKKSLLLLQQCDLRPRKRAEQQGAAYLQQSAEHTNDLLINWSTSELNGQLNPTTCLGDTDCWIQQVTAPTLVVTCWIQQPTCILHSSWTGGASPPCASRW